MCGRAASCPLGRLQVTPDEAKHRGQGGSPRWPFTREPGEHPVSQGRGLRPQDLEADRLVRLEGPGVADPRGAPSLPVGVAELLGPQGRGDDDEPSPSPVVGGPGHHGLGDGQGVAPGWGEGGLVVPEVHTRRVDWGVPVPALDADLDRGGSGGRRAPGDMYRALAHQHQGSGVRGDRPGRGWGRPGIRICHGLEPPPWARAALGGGEAELHPPLDHVINRDPKSRRVRGRDGISLPAGEGEGGDPQGITHELEQLAGSLRILGQEGREAVSLRGMGAGDGGGVLARRPHAASHRRQAFAVQEDSDVQGLAGVRLLQGSIGDERRQAGLVRVQLARRAVGAAGCRRCRVVIQLYRLR